MMNMSREERGSRIFIHRFLPIFILIFGALALAESLFPEEMSLTAEQAALAALVAFIGTMPAILYWRNPSSRYPLIELAMLFHAITYGVIVFSPYLYWRELPHEAITSALAMALSGTCMLLVGALIGRRYDQKQDRFQKWDAGDLRLFAFMLMGLNLLAYAIPAFRSLPTLPHLLETGSWIGIVILYIATLRGRLSSVERWIFFLLLFVEAINRLASGSLANLMILLLVLALVQWREQVRFPKITIFAGLVILAVLNPVKGSWREEIWADNQMLSVTEKIRLLSELTVDYYINSEATLRDVAESNVNRISNIQTLAWVRHICPELVPFWGGESFKSLIYSFVPRFLFPEKPQGTLGNQFGRRYLLLGPYDFTTSFNLPWIADFYVNFGDAGVWAGMFIAGILLGILASMFGGRASDIHFAIGIAASHQLFFAESNFALMWGNVVLDIVAFTLLFTLILKRVKMGVMR